MTADAGSDTPEWLKREQELKDLVFKERSYKAAGWRREALLQDEIAQLRQEIAQLKARLAELEQAP
jgi:ubiquinone biosynthesis protein UbiJ